MDIIFAVKNVEWLPQFPQLIVPPGSASSDGPWASSQTTTNRICDPSLSKSLMLSFLIWMFPRVNVSLRSQEVEVFEAGKFHKRNLRQSHPYGEGAAMTSLGFSSHLTDHGQVLPGWPPPRLLLHRRDRQLPAGWEDEKHSGHVSQGWRRHRGLQELRRQTDAIQNGGRQAALAHAKTEFQVQLFILCSILCHLPMGSKHIQEKIEICRGILGLLAQESPTIPKVKFEDVLFLIGCKSPSTCKVLSLQLHL